MGALFITHPHGENGWEVNDEIWSYSLITLYNVLHGGWAEFAPRYIKPISYHHAAYQINHSAPNLGNSMLVYDEKYRQIMWSIDRLLTTQNKHIILQQP
jgi:hypothetical protein